MPIVAEKVTNDFLFKLVSTSPPTYDVSFVDLEHGNSTMHTATVTWVAPDKWNVKHVQTEEMAMADGVPVCEEIGGTTPEEMQANFKRIFRVGLLKNRTAHTMRFLTRMHEAQREYFCANDDEAAYFVSLCVAMGNFMASSQSPDDDGEALKRIQKLVTERAAEARHENEMREVLRGIVDYARRQIEESDSDSDDDGSRLRPTVQ